jgi:hypothetical protein
MTDKKTPGKRTRKGTDPDHSRAVNDAAEGKK